MLWLTVILNLNSVNILINRDFHLPPCPTAKGITKHCKNVFHTSTTARERNYRRGQITSPSQVQAGLGCLFRYVKGKSSAFQLCTPIMTLCASANISNAFQCPTSVKRYQIQFFVRYTALSFQLALDNGSK